MKGFGLKKKRTLAYVRSQVKKRSPRCQMSQAPWVACQTSRGRRRPRWNWGRLSHGCDQCFDLCDLRGDGIQIVCIYVAEVLSLLWQAMAGVISCRTLDKASFEDNYVGPKRGALLQNLEVKREGIKIYMHVDSHVHLSQHVCRHIYWKLHTWDTEYSRHV